MLAERGRTWPGRAIDVAWTIFAVANLVAMLLFPSWETIPFHLIWVSFTLLYGLRAWGVRTTAFALVFVGTATGVLITVEGRSSHTFPARAIEVPLMTAMFAAMVWHVRRHLTALQQVREISTANQALLDRERRFVQNASHELRTPITVALGHAELLARCMPEGQQADDVAVIVDELSHLRRLTDQLLNLATLDAQSPLRVVPIAVGPLLRQTLRRWAPVERRWSHAGNPSMTIEADVSRLRSALDELVDNAVSHTSAGDRIELSAEMAGDMCAITVADGGPGIPGEILPHVFDRFTRGGTGPPRRSGFGLGLSLVKAVAEAHGGSVRVSADDTGTTVTVLVPAVFDTEPGPPEITCPGPDDHVSRTARR